MAVGACSMLLLLLCDRVYNRPSLGWFVQHRVSCFCQVTQMCCKAAQMVVYHNADDVVLLSGNVMKALFSLLDGAGTLSWFKGYGAAHIGTSSADVLFVVQVCSVWEDFLSTMWHGLQVHCLF